MWFEFVWLWLMKGQLQMVKFIEKITILKPREIESCVLLCSEEPDLGKLNFYVVLAWVGVFLFRIGNKNIGFLLVSGYGL